MNGVTNKTQLAEKRCRDELEKEREEIRLKKKKP